MAAVSDAGITEWKTLADGKRWASELLPQLRRPCLVLLIGEMGAGKTQLARWLLEQMGVKEVASPTFAIHHQYNSASGPIDHVDLYRVQTDADLESSGFWDLVRQPAGLVLVEWADRLPEDVWPKGAQVIRIEIEKVPGGSGEGRRVRLLHLSGA